MTENYEVMIAGAVTNVLQSNIEKLATVMQKNGIDKLNKIKVKTRIAFEKYLSTAAGKYGFSKTILYRDKQVPLYDFYVEMDLKCGFETINSRSIKNLIEYNNFVTVYGSGGLGKSTLFKHFFMNTLLETNYIPIFVELKIINDEETSLIDCIYKSLTNLNFDLEKEYFEISLESGKYIILLDGFDEVMDIKRDKLIREIVTLSDKYGNNKYLMSSRRNDTLFNGWNKSTNFDLLPLDRDSSITLIDKLNYNPEIKTKFLNELKKDLYEKHQSFCANPLLLNLMLLTYEEFAEIPEKVHIFYENAFAVLYSKHDATKAFKRIHKTSEALGYDEFIKILHAMSALSYLDSTINFDYPTLKKYIDNSKKITKIEKFNTEDYITDIVESICLMYLEGLKYNFQHRSFQEYFTAKFILNLPDKIQFELISKLIRKKFTSLNSDSVLELIIEMEKEKFEKVFLIPKLKEIKDFVYNDDEKICYFNFMASTFKSYQIDPQLLHEPEFEDITECISFTYHSSGENRYYPLINYIYLKYSEVYKSLRPLTDAEKYKRLDFIEKYGAFDELSGITTVNLEIVRGNQNLMEDFLKHSSIYIDKFKFCMKLFEVLEKKHKDTDNIVEELFGIEL